MIIAGTGTTLTTTTRLATPTATPNVFASAGSSSSKSLVGGVLGGDPRRGAWSVMPQGASHDMDATQV